MTFDQPSKVSLQTWKQGLHATPKSGGRLRFVSSCQDTPAHHEVSVTMHCAGTCLHVSSAVCLHARPCSWQCARGGRTLASSLLSADHSQAGYRRCIGWCTVGRQGLPSTLNPSISLRRHLLVCTEPGVVASAVITSSLVVLMAVQYACHHLPFILSCTQSISVCIPITVPASLMQ